MTDQEASSFTGTERSPTSTRHLAGASPAARRIAGARRNPSVVGYEQTAPHWLRVLAGMSWRVLVVVAAIVLVFYATSRVQLVFIAVFIALVFTAVLRPLVDVLERVMPRGLATAVALLGERENLGDYLEQVGLLTALFCLASLTLGYLAAKVTKLDERQAIACSMEIGIHNTTIALTIALSVLDSVEVAIPSAVYSIAMYVLATAFGFAITRGRTNAEPTLTPR